MGHKFASMVECRYVNHAGLGIVRTESGPCIAKCATGVHSANMVAGGIAVCPVMEREYANIT